jgi:hypothetical protein
MQHANRIAMRKDTFLPSFNENSPDQSGCIPALPGRDLRFDNGRYPATMFTSFLGTTMIFLIVLPS